MTLSLKLKVILDTNIFISALVFKGKTAEIIRNKTENIEFIFSKELIQETRYKLTNKFYLRQSDLELFNDIITLKGKVYKVYSEIDVCRDPKDNFILSLAQDSKADYIVTGDKDLLELKVWKETKILSLRDFDGYLSQK